MAFSRKFSKTYIPRLALQDSNACEVDHSRLLLQQHGPSSSTSTTSHPPLTTTTFHSNGDGVADSIGLVNETNADFYFFFTEESSLAAHYCILKVRCPQLLEGAVKKRRGYVLNLFKSKKSVASFMGAFYRVLIYLYCGQLDYSSMTTPLTIEMIHIAETYNIKHLSEVCKKHLYSIFTLDNIFDSLTYACSLSLDNVKTLCFDFALENPNFFIMKEAKGLGFELFQEAVGVMTEHYRTGKAHHLPDLNVTESDAIVEDFKSLYVSRATESDVCLVVKGKMIKAHKCMLSALSPKLNELLGSCQPDGTITIDESRFPRLDGAALEDSLKYFYYNQESLDLLNVCNIIEFAKEMELNKLVKVLEKNVFSSTLNIESAPLLMEVAFTQLDDNPELKQKLKERSLSFVIEHMDEIDMSLLTDMPPVIATTILVGIQKIIQTSGVSMTKLAQNIDLKALEPLSLNLLNAAMFSNSRPTEEKLKSKNKKTKDHRKDKRISIKI